MHSHTITSERQPRRRLSLSYAGASSKQPLACTLSPHELRRIVAEMVG
jgi:hypothetical protein